MKVIIIGFGSIGLRHYEILSSHKRVDSITIVSNRKYKSLKTISDLNLVKDLKGFDYFIIASETHKHHEHLKYICSLVKNKIILVEKPLFSKYNEMSLNSNTVFVGYNLRFHPILQQIKKWIIPEEVYSTQINCGQYLPTWRPHQDYTKSYSADINTGGGVLRDLSHELDYIFWLFGDVKDMKYINSKISDLEITSDDVFTAICITNKNIIINLNIDYISKSPIRSIIIHSKYFSIYADLINNTLKKVDINNTIVDKEFDSLDRNDTYLKMHESILMQLSGACKYSEAIKIVKLIDTVEFKRELQL